MLLPMTRLLLVPSEIGVFEMVATAPGVRMEEPILIPESTAWMGVFAMVAMGGFNDGPGRANVVVLSPMTRLLLLPRDTGVPNIVAATPGVSVVLPICTPAPTACAGIVPTPPTTGFGDGCAMSGRGRVLLPITRFDGPRDTGVPARSIGRQFGFHHYCGRPFGQQRRWEKRSPLQELPEQVKRLTRPQLLATARELEGA